jgi:prevent-host-death family protein
MRRIGIRELRQAASVYLRRVEAGETIEVTDRGRPVALLTPLPDASPYEQMVASGLVVEASLSLTDLPAPIAPGPDDELPSTVLERMRER